MEDRLDPKDLLSSHFSVTCRTVGISAELTYNPVLKELCFSWRKGHLYGKPTIRPEQSARNNQPGTISPEQSARNTENWMPVSSTGGRVIWQQLT
jgi:hypothetical protein